MRSRPSAAVVSLEMSTFRSTVKMGRDGVEPPLTTYQIVMLPLQHRPVSNVGINFSSVARKGIEPFSPA
jgi:hypothetical protein